MPSASLAFLLSQKAGLEVRCERCENCLELDVLRLAIEYGESTTLAKLEPKLSPCSRCGGKGRLEPVPKYLPPVGGTKATDA
jgi:hypothetical protein